MALAVIGAGFGRTGTYSLKQALERLGFGPCEHMVNLFAHPERFALWDEAAQRKARGEPIDWERLFAGYRATVDWPGAYFWRELIEAYPDAKVILTVRDPDRWYDSAASTIYRPRRAVRSSPLVRAALAVAGKLDPRAARGLRMTDATIWDGTFGGRFEDRAYALRVFAEHAAAVEATVPADRLLVYEVAEGWTPLCRFLGVPVPDGEPFPHLNDAEAFERRLRQRLGVAFATMGVAIVATVTGAVGLRRWLRRERRIDRAEHRGPRSGAPGQG